MATLLQQKTQKQSYNSDFDLSLGLEFTATQPNILTNNKTIMWKQLQSMLNIPGHLYSDKTVKTKADTKQLNLRGELKSWLCVIFWGLGLLTANRCILSMHKMLKSPIGNIKSAI